MSESMRLAEFAEQREKKLKIASPMPDSFEVAAEMAAEVAAAAREDGIAAQVIYCNLQGDEDEAVLLEEAGDLVELVAPALAAEGGVQVLLPDDEALSFYAGEWADLPSGVSLRAMPQASDGDAAALLGSGGGAAAAFVVLVAPTGAQRQAVEHLLEAAAERGAASDGGGTAVLVVNDRGEGELQGANTTFHVEQVDMVDASGRPYNTAIVTRAYPQAFTVWEDNPEDVEAKDGLCFVDLSEEPHRPPTEKELLMMLDVSRKLFKERCKWK